MTQLKLRQRKNGPDRLMGFGRVRGRLGQGDGWTPPPPPPRALLEWRGSGGGGLPGQNEPYQPGIAKMHHIDPFSIYICHNV